MNKIEQRFQPVEVRVEPAKDGKPSKIVGYAAVAFLMNYLKRHTTWLFIIYRLALGGLLLALLASGRLQAF